MQRDKALHTLKQSEQAMSTLNFHLVDLTQPLQPDMPTWPNDPVMRMEPWSSVEQDGFLLHRLSLGEHSGTHLGAPRHFQPTGVSVEQIGLEKLFAPAMKIKLPPESELLSYKDIVRWEAQHQPIPSDHWLLIETGWSRHWNEQERYCNGFPGVEAEAVRYVCSSRRIVGIGIDSPGVDGAADQHFCANRTLAEHQCLHLENLTNLNPLPASGFWLFIGSLPIVAGSGSPCRVLALIPTA